MFIICSFGVIKDCVAQLVKNPPALQETPVGFPGQGRDRLPAPVFVYMLENN